MSVDMPLSFGDLTYHWNHWQQLYPSVWGYWKTCVNGVKLLILWQFYLLTITIFPCVFQGNIDRSNRIISHISDAKTEMLKVIGMNFVCVFFLHGMQNTEPLATWSEMILKLSVNWTIAI